MTSYPLNSKVCLILSRGILANLEPAFKLVTLPTVFSIAGLDKGLKPRLISNSLTSGCSFMIVATGCDKSIVNEKKDQQILVCWLC